MIANVLIMVIIGGYETFVSRLDLEDHPDQPEWLSKTRPSGRVFALTRVRRARIAEFQDLTKRH